MNTIYCYFPVVDDGLSVVVLHRCTHVVLGVNGDLFFFRRVVQRNLVVAFSL